jgi:hypothetical protein
MKTPALALYLLLGAVGLSAPPGPARSYATRFPRDESSLSEGGLWTGGQTSGLDWCDVATVSGLAYGLEVTDRRRYDDAVALLTGPWAPNQTVQATVHCEHPNGKAWEEVELRLRSSLAPHVATGYEINFRCLKTKDAYSEIVRWDGPVTKFTYLSQHTGARFGVVDGDVVKATIVGNVITVFLNGVEINRATDSTFATGAPGIGFFLHGAVGVNRDYGFSSFSASDQP